MTIGYYLSTAKTKRNAETPIHVLYDDDQWPINVKRQRGILGNRRISRAAHAHEVQAQAGSKRLISYRYQDLAGLLEDERRAESSDRFVQRLKKAFKTEFPTP